MSMATRMKTPPVEQRIRLTGVDWETFERLAASAQRARFAYDQGVLEIMSPGPLHESHGRNLGEFVRIVTRARAIPRMSLGSTTWKRSGAERGIEADDCFYLTAEKVAAAVSARDRRSNDSRDYPVPDLAIEVDLSPPELDRSSLYATIRVPEVWRLVGGRIRIERLGGDGTYRPARTSLFLPVRDSDLQRWVIEEDTSDEAAWENRLIAWAGALAKPRSPRRPRPGAGE